MNQPSHLPALYILVGSHSPSDSSRPTGILQQGSTDQRGHQVKGKAGTGESQGGAIQT